MIEHCIMGTTSMVMWDGRTPYNFGLGSAKPLILLELTLVNLVRYTHR